MPCHHHPELLSEYDVITRSTTEALCNIHFDDNSWSQAKLPVRYGGLGLGTAADLALPAFLSSSAASICLVNNILRQPTNRQEDDDEVQAWLDQNLVLPSNAHKQRNWDNIQCSSAVATLVPILNQHRLACFKAASHPESGVWLNCIPNNRVGTFIDNDTLRIGVALCVGLTVCIPHRCKCGTTVDTFGTLPLSCCFSAGHIPCHSTLNDVVRRGLSAAWILSMLEPSGLDRGDGKRPDRITVYPYSRGRCLIWDATCVNTFASSNLIRAALALDPLPTPLKSGKSPSTLSWADASSSSQLLSRRPVPWGNRRSSFLRIWSADFPCDFRISARVISCSRECLWLFSGGTPSAFCSRTVIR